MGQPRDGDWHAAYVLYHADKSFVSCAASSTTSGPRRTKSSPPACPSASPTAWRSASNTIRATPLFWSFYEERAVDCSVGLALVFSAARRRNPPGASSPLISESRSRCSPAGWSFRKPSAVPAGGGKPALLFFAKPDQPSFLPGSNSLNDAWLSVTRLPVSSPDAGVEETNALVQVLTQEGYRIAESPAPRASKGTHAFPRRGLLLFEDWPADHR